MSDGRFSKLTPRHRACLQLVYERKRTKEIADQLGLAPGTVSSYCAEAIRILGARDRIHAAELLAEHTRATPSNSGGEFEWVAPAPALEPDLLPEARSTIGWKLPYRQGAHHNDIGILARVGWIFALAFAIAIGFGMLAVGIRATSDLVAGRNAAR